jgi:sulfoquinovosyltransferase
VEGNESPPIRKGKRIAMFVEPSPFAYICGYKNRFQNLIRFLQEQGDEVLVVTTHHGAPEEWYGAKVVPSWSFPCPLYPLLPLSLAASPRIFNYVKNFHPDIIHVSTPGIMCFGALLFAKLLSIPIVMSYHTHVPKYIPQYTFSFLVEPMWAVIRFLHNAATLTLATSEEMRKEMVSFGAAAASRIKVWRKGVDAELFHPRYASAAWRHTLSGGEPQRPLIVHVGRLGAEKNLPVLRDILQRIPEARLAFVGDGPYRPELEAMFQGTPTVFTGMLSGEDLSAAYASADAVFTPSETETLGFVVLEAMASGTPVVAARAGGIPDIVEREGETGFLYTPGDVDDAVAKLKRLLFDKAFNAKMAAAGRADVENYDWRASTRQVSEDGYNTAIRIWQQSRKATSDWLPWWTKKAEWQA